MKSPARLLLIEDDSSLGETLQERLRREGYEVEWAATQKAALAAWENNKFDLIILDVGLPDGSGFDFARSVSAQNGPPFIFVTALNGAEQRLEGYEIGAEEYIPKPFHLKELLLRVQHVLDNHAPSRAPNQTTDQAANRASDGAANRAPSGGALILKDGTSIDFAGRRVLARDGRSEFLPGREFELLRLLVARAPQAVSRDEILDRIWGEDRFPSHRTVDNAVVRLRQALGEIGADCIRSVRGIGYQWVA